MKNINYLSTRDTNESKKFTSAQVIKQGIADDGGLFMPSEIVKINEQKLESFLNKNYDELAAYILSLYLTDYDKSDIENIAKQAYSKINFPDGAAKVSKVCDKNNKINVLELYHGRKKSYRERKQRLS